MSSRYEYILVKVPVASIYSNPSFSSEIVTQALIWDKLIIHDKKDNWFKIEQKDGYLGWIHSFYTIDSLLYNENLSLHNVNNWYWVKDRFLYLNLNKNSEFLISFGSLIPCFEEEFFFTLLPNNIKIKINKESLSTYNQVSDYKTNLLSCVKQVIETPYLWGGKSSYGYDCSGLVQSLVKVSCNILLPRDTSEMIKSDNLILTDTPNAGDIVFFKMNKTVDHVGIYLSNIIFIHSSGLVKLNSIDKKSKYYSEKLAINYYGTYKIKL